MNPEAVNVGGMMEGQDSAATSHRRTPNACVRCKSRKIRCDGKLPSCERCVKSKTTCRYDERKRRGPGKSKQYIKSLEQRLKEVETALQTGPVSDEGDAHNKDNDINDAPTAADRLQALTSRWPREITANIINAQHHMRYFERTTFVALPPKLHAIPFMTSALGDINQVWPLFTLREVLKLVDEQYAAGVSNCDDNPTRWAMLNALTAMGVHWKVDNRATRELFPMSWAYFKNAYAIFPELLMQGADIEACRAIVVMALFMQGTADAQTFTNLLSSASQIGQCIGLHLNNVCSEPAEAEKRSRMFWLIYILQCNAAIKFGLQAPVGEVDVQLPDQEPATDSVGTNILRPMSTLALIQSRIHRQLHPGSALWKDHEGMLQALTQLDNDLEAWRAGLPAEIRPPSTPRVVDPGIVQLHFTYYASTWKIHTASSKFQGLLARREPLLLLTSPSPTKGARATIHLLQSLPPQPFAFLWQIICYPVCAVLILVASMLKNPGSPEAGSNVEWMGKFVSFLQEFQLREGCDLESLIDGCCRLYDIASFAKDNVQGQRSWERNDEAVLRQQYRDLYMRLRGSTDPMEVSQGLLTNMPLLRAKAAEVFSGVFEEPSGDGFGSWVPEVLKPRTFSFVFGPKGS